MADLTITYYGHSCFKVCYEKKSVVFDPYEDGSVPGLKLPEGISADAVYCSHDHKDHNAANLIQNNGLNPFPVFRVTVPHDDCEGKIRGFSDITFLKVGSTTIVHMGDVGREPTKEEYEAIERASVILIPVGGYYTIDAVMASKILAKTHAKLNILMHYRRGDTGYDRIADLDMVQKSFPNLKNINETFITFDENAVPSEIITLQPVQ